MPKKVHALGVLLASSAGLLFGLTGGSTAVASPLQPDVVSEVARANTPQLVASGAVSHPAANYMAPLNGEMYVGGLFNAASDTGGTTGGMQNLMSFDIGTNQINDGWRPQANGKVWAVETGAGGVFVGGQFRNIGPVNTGPLAKLDPNTGQVIQSFNPPFNAGQVNQITLKDGKLYVSGSFPGKLLALNPNTGANLGDIALNITDPIPGAWGTTTVHNFAITPTSDRLVATGNFRQVAGQSRTRLFVANLDANGHATLNNWYYPGFAKKCSTDQPRRIAQMHGVDWAPNGSYFVVTGTGQIPERGDVWHPTGTNPPNTTVCDGAGRFNLSDDTKPQWINYSGGDTVWATAVTGPAVYVQGHFQWMDNWDGFASQCLPAGRVCASRKGIAALDPETGRAMPWNGNKPARQGGKSFLVTSDGLWVPSDSMGFHGRPHRGIAFLPLP